MGIVADSDQCSATTRSLEDAEIQEMELFLFTYGKGLLSWVGAFLFAGFSFLPLALSGHAHVLVIAWTVIMLLMGSLTLYSHCVIQSKCRGMRHALSNGYVIVCLSDNRKTRSADRVEKLSPRGPVWRINNKLADWRE